MDIGSKCEYPACELSNFAAHEFIIDGVKCASMEGFLQSLKFEFPAVQKQVCKLVGYAAKLKGKQQRWQGSQTLWWNGNPINRHSSEYQELLDRAYLELSNNKSFRKALSATGNSVLEHSIGSSDPTLTVLTRSEFCNRLTMLRDALKRYENENEARKNNKES
jgi:hypothetical protein